MANKKFSEFVLKTSTSDVSHIVGYNGAENVQITPANFVTGGGTGVFLPLAGGTMVGNTIHNDNVKSIYGTSGDGLEIYHNGSNSHITDTGTGDLYIDAAANFFVRNQANGEVWIKATDGGVSLRYQDSQKLVTTSTGISVTGEARVYSGSNFGYWGVDSGNSYVYLGTNITGYGLSFQTGGSEKMRLDASGNLGLGTSTPFGKLSVNVTSGAPATSGNMTNALTVHNTDGGRAIQLGVNESAALTFINSGYVNNAGIAQPIAFYTGGVERMRLDASGNLGLGVSSITRKFEIGNSNGARNKGIGLNDASNNNRGVLACDTATNDFIFGASTNMRFFTGSSFGGVADLPTNETMVLTSTGNLGIGTSTPYTNLEVAGSGADSIIRLYAAGGTANIRTWEMRAVGVAGEGLVFRQANDANNSYTNRMIIDTDGNVGVGTTTPSVKIEAEGTGEMLRLTDSSATGNPKMSFYQTTNERAYIEYKDSGEQLIIDTDADLVFNTNNTERMRINSGGDVLVAKSSQGLSLTGIELSQDLFRATKADSSPVQLNRLGTNGDIILFYKQTAAVGSISVTTTSTTYNTSSDYRLKEDLQDFQRSRLSF